MPLGEIEGCVLFGFQDAGFVVVAASAAAALRSFVLFGAEELVCWWD